MKGKKISFIIIFSLVIIFGVCLAKFGFASKAALQSQEPVGGTSAVTVQSSYNNRYSSGTHVTSFYYSDNWLLDKSAQVFSGDLAIASVNLASAAYMESSIRDVLVGMGYVEDNIIQKIIIKNIKIIYQSQAMILLLIQ